MERPSAPPEAVIIRLAREAAGLRVADVAAAAGASVTRWTQIETGSESRGGEVRPVRGKPGTIARMAYAVGISPERLRTEGQRPDAAEVLEEIARREAELPRSESAAQGAHAREEPVAAPMLDQVDQERLRPYLEAVLREIQEAVARHGTEPAGAQIFEDPGEVDIWDKSPWSRADRVRGIAAMRLLMDDVLNPGRAGRDASGQLGAECNETITMGD